MVLTYYIRSCSMDTMILTRIKRGAVRTNLLIKNKIAQQRRTLQSNVVRLARAGSIAFMAVHTMVMPVLAMAPSVHAIDPSSEGEPPSTFSVDIHLVVFSTDSKEFKVIEPTLSTLSPGTSLEAEQEAAQAAAAQAAAAAAAQKAAELAAAKAKAAQYYQVNTSTTTDSSSEFWSAFHSAIDLAFGEQYWSSAQWIVEQESGGNPNALNRSSGACGAFQFIDCYGKLHGDMSVANQISAGIKYFAERYGNPGIAADFKQQHGWY